MRKWILDHPVMEKNVKGGSPSYRLLHKVVDEARCVPLFGFVYILSLFLFSPSFRLSSVPSRLARFVCFVYVHSYSSL